MLEYGAKKRLLDAKGMQESIDACFKINDQPYEVPESRLLMIPGFEKYMHEFDYTVPRLKKLTKILKAKVVDCNFRYTKNNKSVYSGYTMRTYGDRKVAFVGITTPESITKSIPSYFQNSRGKYIYTFCSDSTGKMLYSRVQKTVDAARKNGADYVIALGHLGLSGTTSRWTSEAVISHTYGIDAVLDGHSQETYAVNTYTNSRGKAVICSQTGTGFKNVGRLVISDSGHITASLIPTDTYTGSDEAVAAEVKAQTDLYAGTLNKTVCTADELLTIIDPATGKRAVRAAETNLGDFCADALRSVMENGEYHSEAEYVARGDRWLSIDCIEMDWYGRRAAAIYVHG